MIADIIFYILGSILYILEVLLPSWSLYPPEMLQAFTFFGSKFYQLDFFLPGVLVAFVSCVLLLVKFEAALFTLKIIENIINFFRGGKVIES
jgi:hypothetical protein